MTTSESPHNLLFLVKKPLKHIQKQSETFIAKVIHPAKNRKRQPKNFVRIHKPTNKCTANKFITG